MNKSEFHSYLENPTKISEDDTSKLKELVDTFPYFQTGHLLYVKGLHNSGDIRYEEQLKMASACVANRKVLYQLVMQQKLNDAIAQFEEDIAEPVAQPELIPAKETLALPEETNEDKEELVLVTPNVPEEVETTDPVEEASEVEETGDESAITALEENILVEAINSSIQLEVSAYYDINELENLPQDTSDEDNQNATVTSEEVSTPITEDGEQATAEEPQAEPWENEETIVPEELKEEEESVLTDSFDEALDESESTYTEASVDVDGPRTFMEWLNAGDESENQNENESESENEDDSESENEEASFAIASESEDVVDEQKDKEDLIDKFIAEDPKITPNKAEFFSPVNMAKLSVIDDESFVSETLAKIYAKQGNYAKAIKAYDNLSLKYPEKSVYFANLIKSLKAERKQKKKK